MAVLYLLDTSRIDIDNIDISLMEPKRKEKLAKCSTLEHKQELLGAYLLLKDILENNYFLDYSKLEFSYNEYGKPSINNNLHFSISHSKGIVAVMVTTTNIGIDIEVMEDKKENVVKSVLNEEEMKIYKKLDKEKLEYFYQIFCSKEAQGKYLGNGIGIHPRDIEIEYDILLKTYSFKKQQLMIACCGVDNFKVIERYIRRGDNDEICIC